MRKSMVNLKHIVLIIATALLVFGVQSINYSQMEIEFDLLRELELSSDEIYDKTIRSLVWVISKTGYLESQGSGILIDKALRLAVTNYHVVEDSNPIILFFPARDRHGNWINKRDFYVNQSNLKVLGELGYATTGRVVAKDPKTDLAIIELDGLPDTSHEIEHDFSYPIHNHMDKNDRVQILGNPGELELWKWAAGFFQKIEGGMIQIDAGIYRGNSGGPVLNSRGVLIGIATRSNELNKAWAVPANHIADLLKTLQPRKIFSIVNNAEFTMFYQVKWGADGAWEWHTVEPGKALIHWYTGSLRAINLVSPQVRFDYIANDGDTTFHLQELQTYTRNFGSESQPNRVGDGRSYYFSYNFWTQKIALSESQ